VNNLGLEEEEEEIGEVEEVEEEEEGEEYINLEPFGFPILDEDTIVTMKNISPSILTNFNGLRSEYHETILFESGLFCRSYDYLHDAQKFKLFPATIKNVTLKWFMGLGIISIRT